MARFLPVTRKHRLATLTVILALLAAVVTGVGVAGSPSIERSHTVDTRLCPFPLDVNAITKVETHKAGTSTIQVVGPRTITVRNASTGRTATLDSTGSYASNTTTGSVTFSGHQVWFGIGKRVPFLSTDGKGSEGPPDFVLSSGRLSAHVIDPCALVAPSPPSTQPVTTQAPWGLPAYVLSQIGYAGLTPVLGNLVRHDHVHLDLIVKGRKVTIPAGVGMAEPVGGGPCPAGSPPQGDCATRHFFTAGVAFAPLHTHSTSGIIHIESDRPGTFTLGEFFDVWGVRFNASCIGGYCNGGGMELHVFVNGKRVSGDPRNVVLTNHQEIAVVFGGRGDFSTVPSTYKGGWPGLGCGGAGETACYP